jgi:hypothetical protein
MKISGIEQITLIMSKIAYSFELAGLPGFHPVAVYEYALR